jgi:ssDNA-binding Zn-finger/Zn-ribbon topoisomerase 1
MKKLLISLAVLAATVVGFTAAEAGKPGGGTTTPATNLIVGRPAKGMYCADPAKWIQAGYNGANGIYVWNNGTPIKAQNFDKNGYLITPSTGMTWKVTSTGQTGAMTITDATNKVYTATPTSARADIVGDINYNVEYTAEGKTFTGVIRRWNSDCDKCHATPPAHAIANKATTAGTSTCRNCHGLAEKMHTSHAARVSNNTSATACYSCHPSPCYSGVHINLNPVVDCVSCHGSLADSLTGNMWIPGQKGLPKCDNCHVAPYLQDTNIEFKSSTGHGRKSRGAQVLCIVCHNSMHMEQKPTGWGDAVNNCEKCHTVQPSAGNMSNTCGNCHVSSTNPHIVVK